MKPCISARRILLVAAETCHESDLLGALRSSQEVQSSALPFELVFFPLQHEADFLVMLDLLDRVRAGFFEAVYLAPPAATWSRLRSSSTEGQPSLRSRAEPLGLSSLNPEESDKVRQSNIQWELVVWLAAQSASCKKRKVGLVLLFPEDFGGHRREGPASPWSAREVLELERACDVRRGAAFLCQLAGTDQRRPVGVLSNLPLVMRGLYLHWPFLVASGEQLVYHGPLPKFCPCVPAHAPCRGIDSQGELASSLSQSFGKAFWKLCLADLEMQAPRSLREGDQVIVSVPPSWAFSFANGQHSLWSFFSHWAMGTLSRELLRQYSDDAGQVSQYLSSQVPFDTLPTKRSNFSSVCRVSPVGLVLSSSSCSPLPSSSSLPVPSTSLLCTSTSHGARDRRSRSPFRSLQSMARASRSSKRPLVRMRPRGYTPHGHIGVDGGWSSAGASTGVVRTRSVLIFFFLAPCVVCRLNSQGDCVSSGETSQEGTLTTFRSGLMSMSSGAGGTTGMQGDTMAAGYAVGRWRS